MESIDEEVSSKKEENSNGSFIFNLLSIIFLLIIISLISFLFVPRSILISVDQDIPPSHTDSPYDTIDPSIDPNEDEKDEFDIPHEYKVGDVKPQKQRLPHKEDSDVDDLPFSRGMNPMRERKLDILYRLASFINPIHYSVILNVTVKGRNGANQSIVNGYASIHFRIDGDASNLLEFHLEGFSTLKFLGLRTTKGDYVKEVSYHYNKEKKTCVFLLERLLKDGEEYELMLNWNTLVRTNGFYGLYETWETRNNRRYYQLVTQGEAMGTRKWMPSFDEPAMKATLNLTINHPTELNARSNAPISSSNESFTQGIRTTVFSTTRRISPYLYAWSLTDYTEMNTIVNGITVSVIANNHFALNESLNLAENSVKSYFSALSINQTHVFDKMDFIFVPDHLSAMENVGHITSGDLAIDRYDIYAHEMMHQYFGNLITLSWWDEVWINEGLATVYEIDAVHGIGTNEAIDNLRSRRKQHIQKDSLRKTVALKNEVRTEIETWANFEKSYSKGSVILYMMRNLIGEKAWKEGVETFLNKFAFQAVKGDDFLSTIKEISKKYHSDETPEFAYRMATDFFELKGFPLLKIKREGRKMELRQMRFVRGFFGGSSKDNLTLSRDYWRIPIYLVKLDGTPYKTILMSSRYMSIDLETDEELILDPKKIVYFRVVYDRNTYKELAKSEPDMTVTDTIISDLMHSSFSGYAESELLFDVIYTDFQQKHGNSTVNKEIYSLLKTMFTFDHPRLVRVYGLLFNGSISAKNNLKDKYDLPPYDFCHWTNTIEDALKGYSYISRQYIILLFCSEVKNSAKEQDYENFLKSFLSGDNRLFHPSDRNSFIVLLKMHYPNLLADFMVNASQTLDEHEFGSILHDVKEGFDITHTEQLRQIFSNSPRAARENRDFITRIFNEHYAAITEAKELGDKIEASLKKHLTSKYTKSRVLSSRKKPKDLVFPQSVPLQPLQYY